MINCISYTIGQVCVVFVEYTVQPRLPGLNANTPLEDIIKARDHPQQGITVTDLHHFEMEQTRIVNQSTNKHIYLCLTGLQKNMPQNYNSDKIIYKLVS